ncbi:MAG: DUF1376 domain-containing protein [Chitinophagaceae bacterium]|nr:MAG: DUF1376 domain-containing protein [Chitinophagaceae bacterium]
MAQQRDAPAFQEYAANMMARTEYRLMSLAERGMLYTMRMECWVNRRLPADPQKLSRVLGLDLDDVARVLPSVMSFFAEVDGQIHCPELDAYRAHIDAIREKQSKGGRQGAVKTNTKKMTTDVAPRPDRVSGMPQGEPTGYPRVSRGSLVQSNSVQCRS